MYMERTSVKAQSALLDLDVAYTIYMNTHASTYMATSPSYTLYRKELPDRPPPKIAPGQAYLT
jgi:hypothetical protein